MSEQRLYFQLCPELSDGLRCSICDSSESAAEALRTMLDEALLEPEGFAGAQFVVECVLMTPEAFEALPEL